MADGARRRIEAVKRLADFIVDLLFARGRVLNQCCGSRAEGTEGEGERP